MDSTWKEADMRVLVPLLVASASLAAQGGPSAISGSVEPIGFFAFGVELSFSRDVHVTQFALYNSIARDGQFRFVIFVRPGRDPLFLGAVLSFAQDDGPTFKRSDVLD